MEEATPTNSIGHETKIAKAIVVLLCAVPLISTLAYGAVDSLALGILFIIISVISILWIADSMGTGEFRIGAVPIQLPLLGLILIAALQLLPLGPTDAADLVSAAVSRSLSSDPYATRFFLIQLIVYFLFFAAALVYIPGGERRKRIAVVIVVFGSVVAFFGILQRLSMPDAIYGLRPTPQAIPFGPFVNQHHFAALMQMTSGVTLGMLFGRGIGRERKLFVALAAGIMGMAVIFTGSRGGLIAYLCVLALVAVATILQPKHTARRTHVTEDPRRNIFVLAGVGGLIAIVLVSVLLLGGQDSLMRGVGMEQSTDLTSGRTHFWNIAWQIFLSHPILGSGMNSFGVAFTRFDTWNGAFRVEQAHNEYLQMLADGGLLAFTCVAAFIALLVRQGMAAARKETHGLDRSIVTGAFAGCIGILVHSCFDFPLRTPANAFFFLLLVVLIIGNGISGRGSREKAI